MMKLPQSSLSAVIDEAVAEFSRATSFPLAFGGLESNGTTTVTSVAGNRTRSLFGLRVQRARGLGGRAMSEARPRLTPDYARSRLITHDYDTEIGAEDIVTLLAIPVILDGRVRAVLYGGNRSDSRSRQASVPAGIAIAQELANEIRVQDEVERRLAAREAEENPVKADQARIGAVPSAVLEELRNGHAELRALTAAVSDPDIKERLTELGNRFARIGSPATEIESSVHLSKREIDVLVLVARGSTNVEIGQALQLAESTVKSYLKTSMAKLEASTRHAAVATARRLGVIP
ncbi:MAG: helix-turn-helix transcriptional regulator [Leucobacter sp.]|nr:helix-turn-helix transcriptional regulator [Leucobacter sp.]